MFAARALDIPNSGIGAMMRYASKYTDLVSLGQGTPLFPTPQFIYDELHKRSLREPELGMYSDTKVSIENDLVNLIVRQMADDYGFAPNSSQVCLTIGGIGALYASLMSLLEKGDEVIFFDPSYPLHLSQIHLTQATPVFVSYKEEDGWMINLDRLKQAITDKTKVIILTNPNNPTGTVLSLEEVKELEEIVVKHDLILVLDEAYYFLAYGKKVYSPMMRPALRDRTVLCRSFSKEYAMTGWRIGYAYASPEIISKIQSIAIYFSVCPPTPSIVAATIAMSDPRGKVAMEEFKKKFMESRSAICQRLDRLPKLFSYHKPDGAYYIFAKYLGFDMPALDFAKMLVDEAKVITISGASMGPAGAGHLRMSFACDASIVHAAFDRIDEFAKKHNLF